ncbi:MAG: hypothetical protein IJE43_06715 [Alphaproteobacteria bacterium]|nr:hypothetical protein [Alphaproteobacteria bacterium]
MDFVSESHSFIYDTNTVVDLNFSLVTGLTSILIYNDEEDDCYEEKISIDFYSRKAIEKEIAQLSRVSLFKIGNVIMETHDFSFAEGRKQVNFFFHGKANEDKCTMTKSNDDNTYAVNASITQREVLLQHAKKKLVARAS